VDIGGVASDAQVLLIDLGRHSLGLPLDVVAQLVLRNRRRPEIAEPVIVGLNERQRDVRVQVMRRDDVEHRESGDPIGMVERQPMGDTSATIVTEDSELFEPELAHHFDLIERHGTLGIILVIDPVGRLAAVAVAAQIGHDHGVVPRQVRGDEAPRDHRLRRTVQQQDRRTLARHRAVDGDAVDVQRKRLEAGKELQCRTRDRRRLRLGPGRCRQGSRRDHRADLAQHLAARDAVVVHCGLPAFGTSFSKRPLVASVRR
jgi:hypothetical protein